MPNSARAFSCTYSARNSVPGGGFRRLFLQAARLLAGAGKFGRELDRMDADSSNSPGECCCGAIRTSRSCNAGITVIGAGLLVLPFASGVGLLAAFALIVLGMGVPPGLIMALPAQALRPDTRAGGMGVYYTWCYAAMAILPIGAAALGPKAEVVGS
jgi:hypothetical protein